MKKILKNVINKISSIDIDLDKTYKIQRKFYDIIRFNYHQLFEKRINTKLINDDYEIPIRVFFPKTGNNKLIVYFHGGGWVTGNVANYDKVCSKLSKETDCIIASVDYRLAPENPFPIGLEDCYKVVEQFLKDDKLVDIDNKDIILMGDSAGGNLVASISLLCRDRGINIPSKQILLYPVTYNNHTETSPFESVHQNGEEWLLTSKKVNEYMELYIKNEHDLNNYYVAPLLCNDLSNQPKTLIITAELDPLRDEGEAYGLKLQDFDNEVEIHRILDTIHGFFTNTLIPEALEESYKYINSFIGDELDEKK